MIQMILKKKKKAIWKRPSGRKIQEISQAIQQVKLSPPDDPRSKTNQKWAHKITRGGSSFPRLLQNHEPTAVVAVMSEICF